MNPPMIDGFLHQENMPPTNAPSDAPSNEPPHPHRHTHLDDGVQHGGGAWVVLGAEGGLRLGQEPLDLVRSDQLSVGLRLLLGRRVGVELREGRLLGRACVFMTGTGRLCLTRLVHTTCVRRRMTEGASDVWGTSLCRRILQPIKSLPVTKPMCGYKYKRWHKQQVTKTILSIPHFFKIIKRQYFSCFFLLVIAK